MKHALTLILLSLLIAPHTPIGASESKTQKLHADLDHYRSQTVSLLRDHLETDPECILGEIIPALERAVIVAEYNHDLEVRAWCFPEWRLHDGRTTLLIFVNSRLKWKPEAASITIIHEALHLTDICGPDSIRREFPACGLFGRDLFISSDISDALRAHLLR